MMTKKSPTCRDCGATIFDGGYRRGLTGQRFSIPRCRDCHENAVRESVRGEFNAGNRVPRNYEKVTSWYLRKKVYSG